MSPKAVPVRTPTGMVALLFTDLVGSTELLDRLGDDDAEELRRAHFAMLRRAVVEAGGVEVKSLGDGLMVSFASSVEAVRCAVAIQQTIHQHNQAQPDRPLAVRVGLHVGEPVADEDDFFGTSVVVAKRLCDQAKGGEILASEMVATMVGSRGGFHFRPAGRIPLKGLTQPLPAVAVDWEPVRTPLRPAPAEPPRSRAPAPRGPRLVGREREVTLLEAELDRASGGEFSCVLLVGEPGVGKTRLAGELLARHRDRVAALSARAYPLGGTASFGLWAEALERHLRGLPAADVIRLCGGFLDDLAGLLRSVAAARGAAPEGEPPRLRLLEGLAVLFSKLAATAPVVVVLDDVHVADASSWEALRYLAHNLADTRLLVVAAARPAELADHEEAGRVLFGLEQDGLLTRLDVRPLGAGAVGELAQTVIGRAPPPSLVSWLEERSRGNPLFALGLIRALEEEGADLSAPRLRRLPEALADRVAERLKAYDQPTRAILELLAAVGRRVELGEVVAMSGLGMEALGSILERLVRHRFVLEEGRGAELVYEIAHPLIAEAIYESIGRARRRPLHRAIGRVLLDAGRLGEAAPHFAASADPEDPEAVRALTDALRQAEGRGAYREALSVIGSLVDLLPPGDERWRDVAGGLAGQAEWVVDHRADVHAVLGIKALRAIDAALEASPDVARRAAVKLRLGTFLGWGTGDLDEAERVCADARDLFEAAGRPSEALLARLEVAYLASFKGDLPAWVEGARPVAEAAEAIGDRLAAMHALGRGIGVGAVYVGRFEEAHTFLRRGLALAAEDDKPYFQTLCLAMLACGLAMTGRIDEALTAVREAKAVNPDWRDSVLLEYEAIVHWMAGDFAAAVAVARESEAWSPAGVSKRRAMAIPFAVLSALETGQTAEARRHLDRGLAAYGARDWLWCRQSCLSAAAVLAWREENTPDAVDALHRSATAILDIGARPFAAFAFLDLAEIAAESDRVDVAGEAAARLEELAADLDEDVYRGLAALASAWARLASGAPGRAEQPAREAIDFLAATGCRAFSARGLEALGRSLSDRDRPGAVSALQAAATAFQSCGAAWRSDRALETLRQLGTQGRRVAAAVTGPASLTRRERQIARLAAQGHTVRQIAERLYISARTVESHLAAVYAKLGVKSKSELIGRASELDA